MKNLLIICLSLSVLTDGLGPNKHPVNHKPNSLRIHWLKKSRKEVLRDRACIHTISNAIGNSLHFIVCGFTGGKPLF